MQERIRAFGIRFGIETVACLIGLRHDHMRHRKGAARLGLDSSNALETYWLLFIAFI